MSLTSDRPLPALAARKPVPRVAAHLPARPASATWPRGPARKVTPRLGEPLREPSQAHRVAAAAVSAADRLLRAAPAAALAPAAAAAEQEAAPGAGDPPTELRRSSGCRPQSAPRPRYYLPGALAWLDAQPAVDAWRAKEWLQEACSPPERALRRALRQPLHPTAAVGATSPGGEEDALRMKQKALERLILLVRQVEKCKPGGAPVVDAAYRRISRLSSSIEAEQARLTQLGKGQRESGGSSSSAPAGAEPRRPGPLRVAVGRREEPALYEALRVRAACTAGSAAQAGGLPALAVKLVETAETDEQRAWALFCWVAVSVVFDARAPGAGAWHPCDPDSVADDLHGSSLDIAALYQALVSAVGLRAEVIHGHMKDSSCTVGEDVCASDRCRHAWNAVRLGEDWVMVDCACGAGIWEGGGFRRRFCAHFFGLAPEELSFSHLPDDPRWQFLPFQLSAPLFHGQPVVSVGVLFGRGGSFYDEYRPSGLMVLDNTNTGQLRLRAPHEVEIRASIDGDVSRCLVVPPGLSQPCFTVHFRIPYGTDDHKLEVLMGDSGSDEDGFEMACTFVIIAGAEEPRHFVEPPFPRVRSEAFFGNGLAFPEAHPMGRLVLRHSSEAVIQLEAPGDVQLVAELLPADGGEALPRAALVERLPSGAVTLSARCPGPGEYLLRASVRQEVAGEPRCEEAVTYCLIVPDGNVLLDRGGFPEADEHFVALGGQLLLPREGRLAPGVEHQFQVQLTPSFKGRVFVQSAGARLELPLAGACRFAGAAVVEAPSAELVAEVAGAQVLQLLQWEVL